MPAKDLYIFEINNSENNTINAHITFNINNSIYKGHFPQTPITPGVCQVHIIKAVLNKVLNKQFQLFESREIKFLAMHTPVENNKMDMTLTYNNIDNNIISVSCSLFNNNTIYLKFNGKFKSI